MPTFNMQIGGEIIILRTASDKPRLKLKVNGFIKALEDLLVLKENIDEIKYNKLINIEKKKEKTKKAIKIKKKKMKEKLNNRLSFSNAADNCLRGYEEKEIKLKRKHIKIIKEFKAKEKKDKIIE